MKSFVTFFLILCSLSVLSYSQISNGTDGLTNINSNKSFTTKQHSVNKIQNFTGNILYNNGSCINAIGTGPGGANGCVTPTPTLTIGRTCSITKYLFLDYHYNLADDFTVPAGTSWNLDAVKVYVMQVGTPPVSNITKAYIRIWDGIPFEQGSHLIFGDYNTNMLLETSFTGAYCYQPGIVNDNYPLMEVIIKCPVTLPPGKYYMVYEVGDFLKTSAYYSPSVNFPGSLNKGNAMQSIDESGGPALTFMVMDWDSDEDNEVNMDLPFQIYGSIIPLQSNKKYTITSPNGGETLIPGKYATISWSRQGIIPGALVLEYSIDGGLNWTRINNAPIAGLMKYSWLVPQINSTNCLIRIGNYLTNKEYDRSDRVFSIMSTTNVSNFPNPFNPSTKIVFSLQQKTMTSLRIYNNIGQEVSVLVNKELSAGSYEYEFNAGNLPSGVYYYSLTSNGISVTNKMLLVK